MGKIKTYNPKEVTIALGNHIVAGYADDSFITIDPNGDGVTKKVGCDGEIVRSISPDDTYIVKLTVLQTSETNSFLQNRFKQDRQTGDGMFPIIRRPFGTLTRVTYAAGVLWAARGSRQTASISARPRARLSLIRKSVVLRGSR